MTFISTVPESEAEGPAADMYAYINSKMGYIPNYTRLFIHRPDVMEAWGNLLGKVRSEMDIRRYELVTLAAARALRSSYCKLAHGSILKNQKIVEAEALAELAQDFRSAVLTNAEQCMMIYVEKVVRDATQITQADIDELKGHGFSDSEIFDITTTATVRCFFSKTLDALGPTPDEKYLELDENLQKALVVGRPISKP